MAREGEFTAPKGQQMATKWGLMWHLMFLLAFGTNQGKVNTAGFVEVFSCDVRGRKK